jgi:hypothetical protein
MERHLGRLKEVPEVVRTAWLNRPGCGSNSGLQWSSSAYAGATATVASATGPTVAATAACSGQQHHRQQQHQQHEQHLQKQWHRQCRGQSWWWFVVVPGEAGRSGSNNNSGNGNSSSSTLNNCRIFVAIVGACWLGVDFARPDNTPPSPTDPWSVWG